MDELGFAHRQDIRSSFSFTLSIKAIIDSSIFYLLLPEDSILAHRVKSDLVGVVVGLE